MSKAITEEREARGGLGGPDDYRFQEVAPSAMREDEGGFSRVVGMTGLVAALIGADLLLWAFYNISVLRGLRWLQLRIGGGSPTSTQLTLSTVGTIFGTVFLAAGLYGLLFQAICEKGLQLRRTFGVFGGLGLLGGVILLIVTIVSAKYAVWFALAVVVLCLALAFLLAFIRNETEPEWRNLAINLIGAVGAALALVGLGWGYLNNAFLLSNGLTLALLGLAYLGGFVASRGTNDDLASKVGLGIGAFGALMIVLAVGRGLFTHYFVPHGLLLSSVALLYVLLYVLLWVDLPLVAMTHRELAAFFYSPIAYLVALVFSLFGWFALVQFLDRALLLDETQEPLFEPIVRAFFFGIVPVFVILFIVPALTMRSLSEEKRTGTLEVLLTGPVSEWSVVLSKFLATLAFFLLIWLPWGGFLLGLYLEGKESFDYIPILSFFIVLLCTGAGFVSMGLFFSSLTRNQIISFVLTLAGMFALFFVYFAVFMIRFKAPNSPWIPVLNHISFVDLWFNSLDGKLQPQYLLYHISAAIIFLFMTVKVLEARKWA